MSSESSKNKAMGGHSRDRPLNLCNSSARLPTFGPSASSSSASILGGDIADSSEPGFSLPSAIKTPVTSFSQGGPSLSNRVASPRFSIGRSSVSKVPISAASKKSKSSTVGAAGNSLSSHTSHASARFLGRGSRETAVLEKTSTSGIFSGTDATSSKSIKPDFKSLMRKRRLASVSKFDSENGNISLFSERNTINISSSLPNGPSQHYLQLNNAEETLNINSLASENVIGFESAIKMEVGDIDSNFFAFEAEDFGEGKQTIKKGRPPRVFGERTYRNSGSQIKQKTNPKMSDLTDDDLTDNDLPQSDVVLLDCSCPQIDHLDLLNDVGNFEDFISMDSLDTEDNIEQYVEQKSEYQIRKERLAEKFLQNAPHFAEIFVETQFKSSNECERESCSRVGGTFCDLCGTLCRECDILEHSGKLHARYFHGKRIKSGVASDGNFFDNILDLGISKKCRTCKGQMFMSKEAETLKVVKLNGIFTAHHSVYTCADCNITESYTLEDFLTNRLFPLNCDTKANLVCSFDVFDQWQTLSYASPVTALSSYLQCLNMDKLVSVDQMNFDLGYQQYQKIKLTIESNYYGINNFECIAKRAPHAIHADGDLKCKHLKLNQNESSESYSYYGSSFFVPDSEVNAVTEYCSLNGLCSKVPSDVTCGTADWTAAGNALKAKSPVDIRGLQLASCTHLVNLAACNLPRGELFANNLLLQRKLDPIYNIETMGSDVACKYGNWYKKLCSNPKFCEDLDIEPKPTKIVLGDLHSRGHSLDCRIENSVMWNDVGRLQGMEMQEMNNNPFGRGRFTTSFMTKIRRKDRYSEMAYLINKDRNAKMVSMLIKRSKRIEEEIRTAEKVLIKAEKEENIKITDEKIDAVKEAASNVRKKSKSKYQSNLEFYSLSVQVKKSKLLLTFDPAERQKLVKNLKGHHKELKDLVISNNLDPTREKLDIEHCLNGIFPWTKSFLPEEAHDNPARFIELCEVFLKRRNSYKELVIIERDIKAILEQRLIIINNLGLGREMFSDLVNKARTEKQLELISDFLDELKMISDNKRMNIDTESYFKNLNLDPGYTSESPVRMGSKEKMIVQVEQELQDMVIKEHNAALVLDYIL